MSTKMPIDKIGALKNSAAEGDVTAQFKLGDMYEHGKSVKKDGSKARDFYEMAANKGDSEAQLALGFLYSKGKIIDRDFCKAKFWFEQAASQGDEIAKFNLGEIYEFGRGTQQDFKMAFELYTEVCNQENYIGFLALANLYFRGLGTEQNWKATNSLLQKSLNDWEEEDNIILNLIYINAHSDHPKAELLKAREWVDYLLYNKKLTQRKIKSLFSKKYEHNL